jgi:flagellar basal body-associated protein FliL
MYNFTDTTIGFNGKTVSDLDVNPRKDPRSSSSSTWLVIVIALSIVAVAGAIIACVLIKKRNSQLRANLSQYNKLEEEIYQKP